MTSRRSDDISDLPAASRETDGHTHPLPPGFRILLGLYGAFLLLALGGLFGLYLDVRESAAADAIDAKVEAEQLAEQVKAELDKRTAERDLEQAMLQAELDRQRAEVRQAVCLVIVSGDIGRSPGVVQLADRLGCPV